MSTSTAVITAKLFTSRIELRLTQSGPHCDISALAPLLLPALLPALPSFTSMTRRGPLRGVERSGLYRFRLVSCKRSNSPRAARTKRYLPALGFTEASGLASECELAAGGLPQGLPSRASQTL